MRRIGMVLVLLTTAGCAALTSAEPIAFSGTVVDRFNRPLGGATISLEGFDNLELAAAGEPHVAFHAETTSGPDGAFEFRFDPPQDLVEIAARNKGLVVFEARAAVPDENDAWVFGFARTLGPEGWIDPFTPIRWRPVT
jgi:hypothetical protein